MNNNYYSKNANSFYEGTKDVNMDELYEPFTKNLGAGAKVLDAGCGSGRDTLAFLKMGYEVDAFDASPEMVKLASKLTGIDVKEKRFDEIDKVNHYDGIWCCASLLHVPLLDLTKTMKILRRSLKSNGVWYLSFKYGDQEREEKGRHFTDLKEVSLKKLVSVLDGIEILTMWITDDVRPNRPDRWLNAILRKQ
jgi:2-polyprenyl-3-methyl-5-hydroxy-6-metoxy-1,4-benzoquinol methylase